MTAPEEETTARNLNSTGAHLCPPATHELLWHVIQEGNVEADRTPDLRRCERIRWIRAIIENAKDHRVSVWENERRGDRRILLWLEAEDFLVVLAVRNQGYAMLLTAYPTNREHTRRKLRREREQALKKAGPAGEAGPNTPSTHGR